MVFGQSWIIAHPWLPFVLLALGLLCWAWAAWDWYIKKGLEATVGISQRTHGNGSPAFLGTFGNIGPNSVINVGQQSSKSQVAQPHIAEKPNLVSRKVKFQSCSLPFLKDRIRQYVDVDCYVLPIRNSADTTKGTACNVIAHLDFYSEDKEQHLTVAEGWWAEDTTSIRSVQLNIGRSREYSLILAIKVQSECSTLPKKSPDHYPRDGDPISIGAWKVVVTVTAEGYQNFFYLRAVVGDEGTITWSVFST